MSQNNKISFLYNPANLSDKDIISNFVIRLKEFEYLVEAIRSDEMLKPPQHFLILGQRGYGKTILLLRLRLEIKNNNKLNEHSIPILFDEEQYNISDLAKLWEETLKKLTNENEIFGEALNKIDELYERDLPEEEIYNLLISELKKHNKKIILLFDNFGDIIKKFKTKEIQRLREVLTTSSEIKLIAASSILLENFYEYHEPFFEFFRNINLNELNKDETIALLQKLGEQDNSKQINEIIEKQPERIEALRRLTGGVPRTIALLFEIFLDDISGNSFHDLEILIDRVTPLYKHRMDNLPTQQQVIVNSIAQNWDAISTKEIVKITRLPSKVVSSQLNQLEKNQIIEKIRTSTKNNLYQIKERFFNIYYLMRYGNNRDKKNVRWLVRFLEIWLNKEELIERTLKHIKLMQEKKIDKEYAIFISDTLLETNIPTDLKDRLTNEIRKYLEDLELVYSKETDKSKIEIIEDQKKDIYDEKTDATFIKLKEYGFKDSDINLLLGMFFHQKKIDINKAITYYEKSLKGGNIIAMNNLASLYITKFNNFEKAKELYLKAVNLDDKAAMYNLAVLYQTEFKDFKKAEEFYLRAVEKDDVNAMYNLARLYKTEFRDFKKAEEFYLKSAGKNDVNAMYNLAILYENNFKDFQKAEEFYLKAVEKDHIDAMFNLAILYYTQKKNKNKALDLISNAYLKKEDLKFAFIYAIILFWNNEIEKGIEITNKILKSGDSGESGEIDEYYNQALLTLLEFQIAKKQHNYVYKLFEKNNNNIKEKFKPVYYALLKFMGNEYQDEYKKMGGELTETVEEIIKDIEKIAIDYA